MTAPPASAMSHSPLSRLWQARCTATSVELHAVCTLRLGPRRSSSYDDARGEEVRVVAGVADQPLAHRPP